MRRPFHVLGREGLSYTLPLRHYARMPLSPDRKAAIARLTLAPLYLLAGVIHLLRPDIFTPLMPPAIPQPHAVILLTGVAEIAGASALFVPRLRALAGVMLALYALCVYPLNIQHAVRDLSTGAGLGWAYHYPRLFAQPFICWWALVAGRLWFSR